MFHVIGIIRRFTGLSRFANLSVGTLCSRFGFQNPPPHSMTPSSPF